MDRDTLAHRQAGRGLVRVSVSDGVERDEELGQRPTLEWGVLTGLPAPEPRSVSRPPIGLDPWDTGWRTNERRAFSGPSLPPTGREMAF